MERHFASGINEIEVDGKDVDLFDQYVMIEKKHLIKAAERYEGTGSRQAQELSMMTNCLLESLDSTALVKITNRARDYEVNCGGKAVANGPLLFYFIVQYTRKETQATITYLELQLDLMPLVQKLEDLNFNIQNFNDHVEECCVELIKRNMQPPRLITNLLIAYQTTKCPKFAKWAEELQDHHKDGTDILTDAEILMEKALRKYQMLASRSMYVTPQKGGEGQEILALRAEVQSLKRKVKAPGKQT